MTQFTSTKSRPCKVAVFVLRHCRDKNTITNSTFLLFLEVKEKICCLFQDFQAPRPKFKDFPGHGNFFPPIPGLCRIFKDRGNPDQISPSSHYSSNSLQKALKSIDKKVYIILIHLQSPSLTSGGGLFRKFYKPFLS